MKAAKRKKKKKKKVKGNKMTSYIMIMMNFFATLHINNDPRAIMRTKRDGGAHRYIMIQQSQTASGTQIPE